MPGQFFSALLRLGCSVAIAAPATLLAAASPSTPAFAALDQTAGESIRIVISVADQRLALLKDREVVAIYPVSTSKFGVGDEFASYKTPLGAFRIREKIGGDLSAGAVLKDRAATGELLEPDAVGRNAIVSRILSLEGMDTQNRNAGDRGIYIHGTPEESLLGRPVSWGCVRMSSRDVIDLFRAVPLGAAVHITTEPLQFALVRENSSLDKPQIWTLENTQPEVAARFSDMRYTALIQFRLAHVRSSFYSSGSPPLLPDRMACTGLNHELSSTKKIRRYDHH